MIEVVRHGREENSVRNGVSTTETDASTVGARTDRRARCPRSTANYLQISRVVGTIPDAASVEGDKSRSTSPATRTSVSNSRRFELQFHQFGSAIRSGKGHCDLARCLEDLSLPFCGVNRRGKTSQSSIIVRSHPNLNQIHDQLTVAGFHRSCCNRLSMGMQLLCVRRGGRHGSLRQDYALHRSFVTRRRS